MFGRVQLESSDHVSSLLTFLQANPELKPFMHAVVATPAGFKFGPFLPYVPLDLSSFEYIDESQLGELEDGTKNTNLTRIGTRLWTRECPATERVPTHYANTCIDAYVSSRV
ncbi:hypothetical protein GSI_08129 [Ganoderma sinense ZZ0214-1]|uniref:Uncharacterized protein n=1 Tax=Ganoderma sinense ZZ0214-1 TaxID=1077348 RepID=A0A2G8S7F0_9APHY|nr:hypothetical protein GSI_08129 [Ganoderma sinense ZZ0214-1]